MENQRTTNDRHDEWLDSDCFKAIHNRRIHGTTYCNNQLGSLPTIGEAQRVEWMYVERNVWILGVFECRKKIVRAFIVPILAWQVPPTSFQDANDNNQPSTYVRTISQHSL